MVLSDLGLKCCAIVSYGPWIEQPSQLKPSFFH